MKLNDTFSFSTKSDTSVIIYKLSTNKYTLIIHDKEDATVWESIELKRVLNLLNKINKEYKIKDFKSELNEFEKLAKIPDPEFDNPDDDIDKPDDEEKHNEQV